MSRNNFTYVKVAQGVLVCDDGPYPLEQQISIVACMKADCNDINMAKLRSLTKRTGIFDSNTLSQQSILSDRISGSLFRKGQDL